MLGIKVEQAVRVKRRYCKFCLCIFKQKPWRWLTNSFDFLMYSQNWQRTLTLPRCHFLHESCSGIGPNVGFSLPLPSAREEHTSCVESYIPFSPVKGNYINSHFPWNAEHLGLHGKA